jgi:hypothetical protein
VAPLAVVPLVPALPPAALPPAALPAPAPPPVLPIPAVIPIRTSISHLPPGALPTFRIKF